MNKEFNIIKQKLENYEADYDHNEWLKLENKLPKNNFLLSNTGKGITVFSVLSLATIIAVFIALNSSEKDDSFIEPAVVSLNNETDLIINIKDADKHQKSEDVIDAQDRYQPTQKSEKADKYESSPTHKDVEEKEYNDTEENLTAVSKEKDKDKDKDISKDNHAEILENVTPKVVVKNNCVPSKVSFSVDNLPGDYYLVWHTDNNISIKGNSAEVEYQKPGKYSPSVEILYNDEVVKNLFLQQISVFNAPDFIITYADFDDYFIFSAENKKSSSIEDYNFVWRIDNDVFYDNSISYEFHKQGVYDIQLVVYNKYSCKSSYNAQVHVIVEQEFFLPNAFTPASGNENSHFGPIGENLDFKFYSFVVTDNTGKVVFRTNNVNEKWNGKMFNSGSILNGGIYFYEIIAVDVWDNTIKRTGRVNLIRK